MHGVICVGIGKHRGWRIHRISYVTELRRVSDVPAAGDPRHQHMSAGWSRDAGRQNWPGWVM